MLRIEIVRIYQDIREDLNITLNSFPSESSGEKLFGQWSISQVVTHLNGWNQYTCRALDLFNQARKPEWGGDVEEINMRSIAQREGKPWTELMAEFRMMGQLAVVRYNAVLPEYWQSPIWPEHPEITPERSLLDDIDHCGREHLPQIKDVLRSLEG